LTVSFPACCKPLSPSRIMSSVLEITAPADLAELTRSVIPRLNDPNSPRKAEVGVAGVNLVVLLDLAPMPSSYPGIFPATIALINGPYFSAIAAGITASPGASIAGTTSPAPLGPGTLTTPLAYPVG